MSGARYVSLVWGQVRHNNRVFWRTPAAAFFTLALPVIFLILFSVIFGDVEVGGGYSFSQFFAPAMAVFAAVSSSFSNLAIGVSYARDQGILKRVRGTPLPAWVYMAGRICSGVWFAVLSVSIMFILGWAFFGFHMVWANLGTALVVFVVGIATFSALGLAVCAVLKNADSSPAVANGVFLPMAFVSGIFIQLDDAPRWLQILGDIFPLKHFAGPFGEAFDPLRQSPILGWEHLGVMILWLVFGMVIITRYFTWDPRGA
ncbi:MAG: ABC transporter permease [Acidimicrobiia bacterium]|nr:ABC transporter permease [Acidimicrobiia bacterium]MYB45825.1 ABC transporter permease [Acidimicrobiia bacterium]MYC84131.1 ABC transporter permease [Acidimicrobiia bacterium]